MQPRKDDVNDDDDEQLQNEHCQMRNGCNQNAVELSTHTDTQTNTQNTDLYARANIMPLEHIEEVALKNITVKTVQSSCIASICSTVVSLKLMFIFISI